MGSLYDYLLKIIFVGDSNVGKTSILSVYTEATFYKSVPTIGVDFNAKYVTHNKNVYKLHVWDTAGQEKYKTIVNIYYKNANVVIYVFDLTDTTSFYNVISWMNDVNSIITNNYISVLVGNKCDSNNRQISYTEASEFASISNMFYIETSALKNININRLFETILTLVESNLETIYKHEPILIKLDKLPQKSYCC